MKHAASPYKLSALALALTWALYGPSSSLAAEQKQANNPAVNPSVSNAPTATSASAVPAEAASAAAGSAGATSAAARTRVSFAAPQAAAAEPRQGRSALWDDALARAVTAPDDPLERAKRQRQEAVTAFATQTYRTMVGNETTQRYLQNRNLAASSSFPLRLLSTLRQNPWRPAPFMPIAERDLSCYYGIPPYRVPQDYDPNTTPITVQADTVTGDINQSVTYQGDVTVTQGDKLLRADRAHYDVARGYARTEGNILVQGPQLTITSQEYMESNLKTSISDFYAPKFQVNGSGARGSSDHIQVDSNQKSTVISGLEFTTCPVGDDSWYVRAGEVALTQGEALGEAYHTVLYVKDVPVLYLPYINFPISNKRKSGLLYPSLSVGSDNGFDYSQPIYFNLAPNYDYTLTPRLMTKRGLLLSNEFRYMPWQDTYGILTFDYLHHDSNWDLGDDFDSGERYFFKWQQQSYFFNRDLVIDLDYQRVRNHDYNYITDIGPEGTNVTDDHLRQSLKATYDDPRFTVAAEVRGYQRLLPDYAIYARPFSLLPQIKGSFYDTYGPFTFGVNAEATRFSSSTEGYEFDTFEATRLHLEPDVNWQMFNSRGTSVAANVKGFLTHYSQDSLEQMPDYYRDSLGFSDLASSTTRALYMVELKGKTTLERKVLDLRHTQTLEPEIQYQYIPYENQDDIALYDTTDRMSDFYSNFSYRHFTGHDRIADLNNITFGLTSRLLDAHDRELMRVGVSQTYSFVPTRVKLNPNDSDDLSPRSPLSVFFNASPIEGLTTHANVTYTNDTNEIASWNAMAQYRNENGFMVQVSYRFTDDGNRSFSDNIIDLKQIGVVTQVPLGRNFSLALASYRDLEQSENIDTKVALKFEDCCWSLAFIYENYNSCDWRDLEYRQDHRFGISFEFKGVGAVNFSGNVDKDYTDTILLDHFDPTNLNQ